MIRRWRNVRLKREIGGTTAPLQSAVCSGSGFILRKSVLLFSSKPFFTPTMNRLALLPRMASRCFCCRYNSTAAAAEAKAPALDIPPGTNEARVFSPKIQSLVDQIAQLNLLEVSDLNECLKKTLKIEAMPMAMAGPAVAAQAASEEDSVQEAKGAVKSSFAVKLTKFDESKKVAVIKEVKNLVEGLNLVQAKKFVESLPQIIRADASKDEATKIKEALEAHGATVVLE